MVLREFRTSEELIELLARELEGDRHRENPSTAFIESTLRIAISGEFSITHLDVVGYPFESPQYIYCTDFSEDQHPFMHVRSPLGDIDEKILHEGAKLVLERYRSEVKRHGRLIISADEATSNAFESLLAEVLERPVKRLSNAECGMFYMTAEQLHWLLTMPIIPPSGYSLEPVDVEKDGETIHSAWINGINSKVTKERLRCFPSMCLRDNAGQLAGWAMSGRFGQISNEFVVPEHRGKGLSKTVELAVAQLLAREDRRVFKYVHDINTIAYESSVRSPLWTLWKENGERRSVYFRRYEIEKEDVNENIF